jgi:flagellar assembly protein FliH
MRIRVNPEDLSLISMPEPDGREPVAIAPNRDVRWLADVRIAQGGCVVEGRERIVDGRIDTALERLYRSVSGINA